MSVPISLQGLVGEWRGMNRLWLEPDQEALESETTASISLSARAKFLSLRYTWTDHGHPQEGLLLIGQGPKGVTAAWVDSWHMGDEMMLCKGYVAPDGKVYVKGSYPAPSGPDWGWRITLEPRADDRFLLVMDNITPQDDEMLAVIAEYERQLEV